MEKQTWRQILVGSISLIALGGVLWGSRSQHRLNEEQAQLMTLRKANNELKRQQAKTHGELTLAQTEQKKAQSKAQAAQSNRGVKPQVQQTNQEMTTTITQVFHGLYDYEPATYQQRGAKLKSKLTPALYQQYFGKKATTYGDGGQVQSKLTKITVYQPAVSGSELKALVLAQYQSKYQENNQWQSGKAIYEVHYNAANQRVSAIQTVVSRNQN